MEWPAEGDDVEIPIGVFYRSRRPAYETCGRPGQPVVSLLFDIGVVKKALEDFR